jgi:hypothetical protein
MNSYRVRLIRFDRPEVQTITVRSENESAARAHVLARVGHGWQIASAEIARLP